MSVNIYPGNATINNQLIVGSNVGVGGDMFVGSNVTISGNLVANNVTGNITVNANINITSPSSTIAVTSNIAGSVFTLDLSGTLVRNISGFFGDVGITNTDGTVLITSNGNGFSFDTCTNAILPIGTRYGDYLFWNGSAFAVGDTQVSIGGSAGSNQGVYAVAVGYQAGQISQDRLTVAVGYNAGNINQSRGAVAVGYGAGTCNQDIFAVSVGFGAGAYNQGSNSVAIGLESGQRDQSIAAVAIGYGAGSNNQAANAVAIGYQAGNTSQGLHSIAIGAIAGYLNQPANSIVLNATGLSLNANTVGFFVSPVRNVSATSNLLGYNPLTTEIGYTSVAGGDQWSTFPAVSAIDTHNFDITTTIGSVNVSGDTNFLGSDVPIAPLGSITYCNVTGSNSFNVGSIGPEYTSVKVEMWGAGGGTGGTGGTGGISEGSPGGGGYVVFQTDVSDATNITAIAGTAGNNTSNTVGGASSTRGGGAAGGNGVSVGGGGGGGASILSINGTVYGIAGGGGGSAPNFTYINPGQGIYNAFYSIGGNAGSTAANGSAIIQTSQNGSLPIFTIVGGGGGSNDGFGKPGGSGYGTGGSNSNGSLGGQGANASSPDPITTALGGSGGIGTLTFAYGGGGGGGGYGGGGGGGASVIGNLGYILGYTIPSAGGGGGSSYIKGGTSNISNSSPSSTQGNPAFLCTVPTFTTRGYAKNDGFIRLTFYNSSGAHAVTSLVTIPDGSIQAQEFNTGKYLLPSLISNASAYVFSFSNLRSGTLAAGLYKTCAYSYDASSSDYSYSTVFYDYGGSAHMTNNSVSGSLQESIRASNQYWLSNTNGAFNYGNIMVSVTKIG